MTEYAKKRDSISLRLSDARHKARPNLPFVLFTVAFQNWRSRLVRRVSGTWAAFEKWDGDIWLI